jgi:hypothetical protein
VSDISQGEEGASTGWLTEMNKTVASFAGYITAVVISSRELGSGMWFGWYASYNWRRGTEFM